MARIGARDRHVVDDAAVHHFDLPRSRVKPPTRRLPNDDRWNLTGSNKPGRLDVARPTSRQCLDISLHEVRGLEPVEATGCRPTAT